MLAKYGFVYQPTPLVPGGALCPFDSTTISPAAQFGQMLQLQKEKRRRRWRSMVLLASVSVPVPC